MPPFNLANDGCPVDFGNVAKIPPGSGSHLRSPESGLKKSASIAVKIKLRCQVIPYGLVGTRFPETTIWWATDFAVTTW